MDLTDDRSRRQFANGLKALTRAYDRFCSTREIEDLDIAEQLCEKLNAEYEMTLDLLEYVELGRALLSGQAPPDNK
jgi:hypothetical protein